MSTALGGYGEPDVNHGPKLLAATLVVTIAALLSVSARMWVRKIMIKSVGWDDYFICGAMLISLIAEALTIADVNYGAGRHEVYLTDAAKLSYGLYLNFISQPFFLVAVVLVKVSVGLFLLRLTPSQFFHRFIWCMIGFMAMYTTVSLITILTQCRPLTVIWDPSVKAICFTPLGLRACAYFNATCGIFADLVFALLPIPMLWNVKINMRIKIALFAILSLGLFATAACVVKVVYLSSYGKYNDFLWDSVNITIWTSCELNIAIFAASIATLKPLFRATFQNSTFGSGYNNSKDKSMDKSGFVKHISNSGGTSKIGGTLSKDDDFEMYCNVITASGKRGRIDVDNESEESILPLQNPGILKTTQVNVSVDRYGADEKV
ncbi:uncharacterized protein LY89DRAFT_682224 [Mollisia scopiformis]|uniref:Rhodopsin domain-containing protein n=1 Tax=Mollisia scopiformis TaxID=149040 RepID=A0A194XL51_MOLSC|nr:uncharacterized protein LY89DRAFT_682224 [Mollisia scopiformis]KUJ20502.1 hypothetical protein LY89DRAFT_682224 [Mollisia scopiformis]